MKCQNCGERVYPKAKYCTKCGQKLDTRTVLYKKKPEAEKNNKLSMIKPQTIIIVLAIIAGITCFGSIGGEDDILVWFLDGFFGVIQIIFMAWPIILIALLIVLIIKMGKR